MRADHEIGPPESDPRLLGRKPNGSLRKRMRSIRSGSGMHLAHNSAKLKIFNLPKHYPVVKVLASRPGTNLSPFPSDPLVGGSISHGSEER